MGFKHRDITKQKVFARTEEIYATRGFEESCKCIRLQNQPKTLSWFARNEDETPHKKSTDWPGICASGNPCFSLP